MIKSKESARLLYHERAEFLGNEFLRRPKMVGFRYELEGVDPSLSTIGKETLSLYAYEAEELPEEGQIPLVINVIWRKRF